jgi:ABC-type sugar transport system permease subunit
MTERARTWLLAAPLLALLLWSVVYPNAAIVVGSFADDLQHWREFLGSPGDREAVVDTLII